MREIKFRAWDTENEKIINSYAHISKSGQFYTAWTSNDRDREYIPMQFTGLKDKNGVEIYEGDIVKANINNVVSIGKVVYIDDWAMFQTEFTIGNIGRYNCYEADEVIGNIYENPELLDKK
jgi:uncharacterized phage protein (TIGR01671 family)